MHPHGELSLLGYQYPQTGLEREMFAPDMASLCTSSSNQGQDPSYNDKNRSQESCPGFLGIIKCDFARIPECIASFSRTYKVSLSLGLLLSQHEWPS
jgi:hypothetical protein